MRSFQSRLLFPETLSRLYSVSKEGLRDVCVRDQMVKCIGFSSLKGITIFPCTVDAARRQPVS